MATGCDTPALCLGQGVRGRRGLDLTRGGPWWLGDGDAAPVTFGGEEQRGRRVATARRERRDEARVPGEE